MPIFINPHKNSSVKNHKTIKKYYIKNNYKKPTWLMYLL